MFRFVGKTLDCATKATSQAVNAKSVAPAVFIDALPAFYFCDPTTKLLPSIKSNIGTRFSAVSASVNGFNQVRFAHTDLKIPDLSEYRRKETKDPKKRNSETARERLTYTYMLTGLGGVSGAVMIKGTVRGLLETMQPNAAELALAKIEVNLSEIPLGTNVTFKWRGSPLFVRHRTPEEIERESKVDVASLRDPQHDSERTKKPEWLIVLGICTHLGCVPIPNAGEFNGYFCPCHGSHYDGSGRVRKGPAPLNLTVPDHDFQGDILVVG